MDQTCAETLFRTRAWTCALLAGFLAVPEPGIASSAGTDDRGAAQDGRASRVAALVERLGSRDAAARAEAAKLLAREGPDAIRDMAVAAGPKPRLWAPVTRIIAGYGKKAVPRLLGLLAEPEIRDFCGEALFRAANPDSVGMAPGLLACMKDEAVKHYCGRALVRAMGPKAGTQVPALREALRSPDKDVRMYAAGALGQVGGAARPAVPDLALLIGDADRDVRWSAASAVGKIGRRAREAVPALEAALKSDDAELRRLAQEALKRIRG